MASSMILPAVNLHEFWDLQWPCLITKGYSDFSIGLSENRVPKNPLANQHVPL